MRQEINDLFKDFDSDVITISDLNIVVQGTLVTHLHRAEDGDVELWAGNPDTDKDAEEILVSNAEWRGVMEQVLEEM